MKKLIIFFALVVSTATLTTAQQVAMLKNVKTGSVAKAAAFNWEKTNHNFGKIAVNKPVTAIFQFKNNGQAPLVLSEVKGSCGCTATEYTKEAIAPGKTGFIKATYNAASVGAFHKTVTVTANTGEGPVVLTLQGEVVAQ